mmetsp:Transcript_27152/g.66027  ORF Transcript_27152/g.66027 Transcript_27152/m.66027 type:complete len:316 (-) Transcript_27152:97-1044(-)
MPVRNRNPFSAHNVTFILITFIGFLLLLGQDSQLNVHILLPSAVKENQTQLHLPPWNVLKTSFSSEAPRWGAVLLPRYKLVICGIPKAGITQVKWLIARIQSNVTVCHDIHRKPLSLFGDFELVRDLPYQKIRAIFTSDEYTKIAFLRDPWMRAVSSYKYQLRTRPKAYGRIYNPSSREDFLTFTNKRQGFGLHSAEAAEGYCGLKYLRYDYYLDIEHEAFGKFLTVVPQIPKEVVTTGWRKCTVDGNPSLAHSKGHTHHSNDMGATSITEKIRLIDQDLCNDTVARAVFERYIHDYRFMKRIGFRYTKPHECTG